MEEQVIGLAATSLRVSASFIAGVRLLQNDGRNLLLLHQVVVGSNVGRDDCLPGSQLLIDVFAKHVEDFVGLSGGSRISTLHNAAQSNEVIVQANWKIEHVLAALGLGLDECFLDYRHFLVERLPGVGDCLGAGILFHASVDRLDLIAEIANLNNGVISFGNLVPDFEKQIELF